MDGKEGEGNDSKREGMGEKIVSGGASGGRGREISKRGLQQGPWREGVAVHTHIVRSVREEQITKLCSRNRNNKTHRLITLAAATKRYRRCRIMLCAVKLAVIEEVPFQQVGRAPRHRTFEAPFMICISVMRKVK